MPVQQVPLKIVGGSNYGRYAKISSERTFNMIISDGILVPFAGYKNVLSLNSESMGRGLFSSTPLNKMVSVVGNEVFLIDKNINRTKIGEIETHTGEVSIDENQKREISICDKKKLYIYNYNIGTFTTCSLDFTPGYVCFQDGYFICPEVDRPAWRLNNLENTTDFPPINTGTFQTKPDTVLACLRVPGRENLLLVFGETVTQLWSNLGRQLFPYERSSSYNIDFGCVNSATIATLDKMICWLAKNGTSGPVILWTDATSDPKELSNEGVNFRLSQLKNPEDSYGFMFKQDGHIIYQLTFPSDNYSLIYDFSTGQSFDVTDQYMNYHIARSVVAFNNSYYFVSNKDGDLYEFSTKYTSFIMNGVEKEIPRVRVLPPIRFPDTKTFKVDKISFMIEQGMSNKKQYVDMSISSNGGVDFSNYVRYELNKLGYRRNQFNQNALGLHNDFCLQLRFWGKDRFVVGDGIAWIRS